MIISCALTAAVFNKSIDWAVLWPQKHYITFFWLIFSFAWVCVLHAYKYFNIYIYTNIYMYTYSVYGHTFIYNIAINTYMSRNFIFWIITSLKQNAFSGQVYTCLSGTLYSSAVVEWSSTYISHIASRSNLTELSV